MKKCDRYWEHNQGAAVTDTFHLFGLRKVTLGYSMNSTFLESSPLHTCARLRLLHEDGRLD